ncbi:15315_t:CDS:2, partial [Cetraspora pellucida]
MTVSKFYTVDPSIGTCICFAVLGRSLCKYQAAVVIKYHKGSFNFISAFFIDDYIVYRYIAYETVANDSVFYTSLHVPLMTKNSQMIIKPIQDIQDTLQSLDEDAPTVYDHNISICDPNNIEDINAHVEMLKNFFYHILDNIKNNSQLFAGLENFKK